MRDQWESEERSAVEEERLSSSGASVDSSSVLLLGSPMDRRTLEAGLSLLVDDDPAETRVLWVTMLNTPREVVDIWSDYYPTRPDRLRVVLVGDGLSAGTTGAQWVETDAVTDPADLTTLGLRLLDALSTVTDTDADVRLRFDSLTPLLQYVDARALSQFLHVLTNRLGDAGVRAHFHLDPMAHDSQTVNAIGSICDAQVVVDEDGVSVAGR